MHDTLPILFVSTGRTGTLFLSRIFTDLYPQTVSYHERGLSRLIQILTHAHFSGCFPVNSIQSILKYLHGSDLSQCPQKFLINSNSFYYGSVDLISEIYPGLRVIHIIRDPRTYVISHLNFQLQRPTSYLANRFIPFWQPNPFLVGQFSFSESKRMSRFGKFCWIWDFKNQIMEQIGKTTIPYLRIRFEDIFNPDTYEESFGAIADFIGLPRKKNVTGRFQQAINASTKNVYLNWPDWTTQECKTLHHFCGTRMKKYGYGNDLEWQNKLGNRKIDES